MSTKEQINRLHLAFPSLAKWYTSLGDDEADGVRVAWAMQLSKVHADDLSQAVDDLINGNEDMPANYEFDRTAVKIKRIATVYGNRRSERENATRLKTEATRSNCSEQTLRFFDGIRASREWGMAVKEGKATADENAIAMNQIHQYHRGTVASLPKAPSVREQRL